MVRERISGFVGRFRSLLRDAFGEKHTPTQIARTFAFGTFVSVLPTLGVGLVVFAIVSYLFDSISKLTLAAVLLLFNPPLKWGLYLVSFVIGTLLLGPTDGAALTELSLQAGPEVFVRMLVGNVILAFVLGAVGYVVVFRLATSYQASPVGETIEEALEEIGEEIGEPASD